MHRSRSTATSGRSRGARLALSALTVLFAVAIAPPAAGAATVVSRQVHVMVGDDGSVVERVGIRVRLDEAADLDAWSPYAIVLDSNRELVSASAQAVRPDGSRWIAGDDDVETVEGASGAGVLHSSAGLHLLHVPPLPAGSELSLAYEVREEPWFESGAVRLAGAEPVESLTVRVEVAPGLVGEEGLRWLLDEPGGEGAGASEEPSEGETGGDVGSSFEVEETPRRLTLRAADLDRLETGDRAPVLRYAWGPVRTWPEVAGWYAELTEDVARAAPDVRAAAREAVGDLETPRDRVEALLGLVRRQVRYVAVEVGVGGYRPSAPADVLERRWGDCKDKSFLLLDLLDEAGIEAYPALVRLDRDRTIDERFPSAGQFNHLIVAVPVAGSDLGLGAAEVIADGYLFLDPTQERGGLTWIHPALQGQHALVVRGEGSGLATLPVLVDGERKELDVRLTVGEDGAGTGEAVLRLAGQGAWRLAEGTASAAPDRLDELATRLLEALLDGAEVGTPRWREGELDGLPLLELSAPVRFERLLEGRTVPSMALPGPTAFPSLDALDDRGDPIAVDPVRWTTVWTLSLPEGSCAPGGPEVAVSNGVGSFVQSLEPLGTPPEPGEVRIERRAELLLRWIGAADLEAARELALAERRTVRRRIRFACGAGS